MKRILAMLLVLAMALSLSACHKHSWEPATCDKPKTCSECGKTEGDPLGHKWGEPVYEWAEDMSSVTALRICENDPAHVESETVETSAEETRSATCTEAGETTFTAQFENSVFAPQSRTEALPEALGHAWGEPEYEWAEDMSSVVATRVCEHDPAHAETEIAETVSEVTKTPTCTEAGERVYSATFGNEAFEAQNRAVEDVPAYGHLWETPVFEWSDDLSQVTMTRVCANDPSHVETETVETTAKAAVAASCEEPGETVYTAAFSDAEIEEQTRTEPNVEPLGHDWGEVSYAWAEDMSTVTATRVCRRDPSHVETETAAVTAEVVKPATCSEPGDTAYTASFENPAFEAQSRTETDIEALGHAWSETEYEWAEDKGEITATRVCANDPSHVETETAAVTAEIVKEAGCETAGETSYSAAFENPDFALNDYIEADIEPLGHAWGEPVYEWTEDRSSVSATRVCANDPAHVESETAWSMAEVVKEASCEEKGETRYSVEFENPAFAPQSCTEADIPATGHNWAKATHTQPQTCTVCGMTEGEALAIHYFDPSFKDYRYTFNHSYPGFLYIDETGKGFTLHVKGSRIVSTGLDETIRFRHGDEFASDAADSRKELKRFNLIEIEYRSDSGAFDTSISARVAQFGYYAAKILDPTLGQTAFFKDGLDLFDAKGNEQSFTHNGFVYTLACEQDGGHYRYTFRMTLESNLE